ncbi:MAG: hypothetical protein L0H41_10200 [Microlunatus sp.]|nr:hypothetical protein [Microlunatus sp.]
MSTAKARRAPRCDRVVADLNAEWDLLRDGRDEVSEWTGRNSGLVACRHLGDVLDLIAADPDAVLGFLVAEAQRGSGTAARVVLQAMLGKLVLMARRQPWAGVGDYVSAMWDCIASFPLDRRPARIAANLALDTHKMVVRESRIAAQVVLWPHEGRFEAAIDRQAQRDALDHSRDIALLTARGVLASAEELGLVDQKTSAILRSVYEDGLSPQEVARRHAMSPSGVRQRCSRAMRELANHAEALAAAG